MMRKGKGLEFPEGRGGSGIRKADSDDRGFPLSILVWYKIVYQYI